MWITLTDDDVKRRLAAAEYSALLNAAKQSDQDPADLVAEAISEITKQVRGYVAACNKNTLGEGATIPDELKAAALALVRAYLFTRLPGLRSLNDELRQRETDQAIDQLKAVALCNFAVVPPETPAEDQAGGPAIQLVRYRKTIAGRSDTNGLF
jgi:hypothetical protein